MRDQLVINAPNDLADRPVDDELVGNWSDSSVPAIRRNWMYAPGIRSRGRLPSTSTPSTVGVGSSAMNTILVAASCCS
jgi:hypothetical protein